MNQHQDLGTIESAVGSEIVVDGKRYINFGGSSYLGMSAQSQVLDAGVAVLRQCGSGVPFPPNHGLILQVHRDVEREAVRFFESQSALYVGSGYYFGLAAIAAIQEQFSAIFFDELSHFALHEAIAASRLVSHAFGHLDAEDLSRKLQQHLRPKERPLVVTDGMYSTFGEIAPVDELVRVAAEYDGRVLVDESHSFGVLGARGRGAAEQHGVPESMIIRGGSLGKAFGTCGGIVLGSNEEIAAVRRTRVGRGASQGLPAGAAMCAASLKYIREHPERLQRLRSNVSYMKSALRGLGLEIQQTIAPVASFVPSGKSPRILKAELMSRGIFVYHSTYIGAGASGVIRCGIFSDHTSEHIDHLVDALRALL